MTNTIACGAIAQLYLAWLLARSGFVASLADGFGNVMQ